MEQQELLPHLFRTEFRKIASVLCQWLGMEHIQAAEDIASDTFLLAFETWPYKGIPANPVAWLYTVAKNKARNHLSRRQLFEKKVAVAWKQSAAAPADIADIDLSDKNISDSQLQMLFAICHPSLSAEAQIGLALRILCGFGIDEIADAFLTSKDTINKRLFRAKEKLRQEKVPVCFPPPGQVSERLQTVLQTIYLLFNEGYYSESRDAIMRNELCLEAMRLAYLLLEYAPTNQPAVNALLALMCFHASRFDARKGNNGEMILYKDQDESRWNRELIAKGVYLLHCASRGEEISTYHLEANIAWWHTVKKDSEEKWEHILQLYNQLLQLAYSPVAALNRTYALYRARGRAAAIAAAEQLQLPGNHFYHVLMAELYQDADAGRAIMHLQKALMLARTLTDKQTIRQKLNMLGEADALTPTE